MDYLKFGKSLKHFKYPPKLPEDKEIKKWGNDTIPLIEKKLESLATWGNYLDRKYGARQRITARSCSEGSLEEWFCHEYATTEYRERHFVSKWQRYWLEILDRLNPIALSDDIRTSLDIPKAKQFPIEQIYTGELRQAYGKFSGRCPFHEEKTPSFFIYPDNRYHCFGCTENGDSIDFVMRFKNMEFVEAVKWLTM